VDIYRPIIDVFLNGASESSNTKEVPWYLLWMLNLVDHLNAEYRKRLHEFTWKKALQTSSNSTEVLLPFADILSAFSEGGLHGNPENTHIIQLSFTLPDIEETFILDVPLVSGKQVRICAILSLHIQQKSMRLLSSMISLLMLIDALTIELKEGEGGKMSLSVNYKSRSLLQIRHQGTAPASVPFVVEPGQSFDFVEGDSQPRLDIKLLSAQISSTPVKLSEIEQKLQKLSTRVKKIKVCSQTLSQTDPLPTILVKKLTTFVQLIPSQVTFTDASIQQYLEERVPDLCCDAIMKFMEGKIKPPSFGSSDMSSWKFNTNDAFKSLNMVEVEKIESKYQVPKQSIYLHAFVILRFNATVFKLLIESANARGLVGLFFLSMNIYLWFYSQFANYLLFRLVPRGSHSAPLLHE
jgi:hypothetical protein